MFHHVSINMFSAVLFVTKQLLKTFQHLFTCFFSVFFKERPAINPKSPNTCIYFMICSHKNNNFSRSYNINFHRTYVYIYVTICSHQFYFFRFSLSIFTLFHQSAKKNRKPGVPTSQRSKSLNKFILFRIHGTIPAIGPPVRAPGHGWSAGLSPKIEDTQRAQHNLGGDHSYVGMDQYLWKYHF